MDGSTVVNVARRQRVDYVGIVKKAPSPKAFLDTYSALTRTLTAMLAQMYSDAEIGATQAKLVRHVARSGSISQAELARSTRTDPALTGRALQGLIDRNVLRRERSEVDRREYLLEIGSAGPAMLARVERVRERLSERLVRPLDARDLQDFDRIASKLMAAFGTESQVASDDVRKPASRPRARAR
jgi:DNA-binding MarR family transcriptional regulator